MKDVLKGIYRILILCANNDSIQDYKSVKILKSFCDRIENRDKNCKNIRKLEIYYGGLDRDRRKPENVQIFSDIKMEGDKIRRLKEGGEIEIEHKILREDLGDINKGELEKNFRENKFDMIINENCERDIREDQKGYGIKILTLNSIIKELLKKDGIYIDDAKASERLNKLKRGGFDEIYKGLLDEMIDVGIFSIEENFMRKGKERKANSYWKSYKLRGQRGGKKSKKKKRRREQKKNKKKT
jgi:hypothetical protein